MLVPASRGSHGSALLGSYAFFSFFKGTSEQDNTQPVILSGRIMGHYGPVWVI